MGIPPKTESSGIRSPRHLVEKIPHQLLTNKRLVFVESIVLLLVGWTTVVLVFDITDIVATPWTVAAATSDLLTSEDWTLHVLATLRRGIYGFLVTIGVGTPLGIAMGLSTFWKKALQDYITISLAIPALFVVVFTAMWFGISDVTPTVAGAVISFPYVAQNVYEATADIDRGLFTMSNAFGVSRRRVIWRVVLRSILPEWFAGARYAFAMCWQITTLAELVAAENGVGHMIELQMATLSLTGVLSWTILFTIILLVAEYGVFQQIEKRVFDWRQQTEMGWM